MDTELISMHYSLPILYSLYMIHTVCDIRYMTDPYNLYSMTRTV